MADRLTPEQRTRNMKAIRSRDTGIEWIVRRLLWSRGVRGYRVHSKLPGKPDITFTRHKVAVFLDGCFWHGCPRCFRLPATNTAYWDEKISRNRERDSAVQRELTLAGWEVLRFWEHEVKENPVRVADAIEAARAARRPQPG